MVLNIDFDGTCVTHDFPKVGRNIGAQEVLRKLVEQGHQLILFTMRSDVVEPYSKDPNIITEPGDYLTQAVNWFKENNIPLYGIQSNPTQITWTQSPKSYAELMIDDSALGCPLIYGMHKRPFVDWEAVANMLIISKILKV